MTTYTPRAVRGGRATSVVPRPFLKWAGGKGQLLGELIPRIRDGLRGGGGYHEPFIGGGAALFELARLGELPARTTLSDANPNLIEVYREVRDHTPALVELLRAHKARHDEAHYYAVRAVVPESPTERAARILYLNRTCFNGLYRENSKGKFNVPFGRYNNPEIFDEANLTSAAAALRSVEISQADFGDVANRARPGDFVYFDPPYDPVSATASFTAYAKGGFGPNEQRRLRDLCVRLAEGGVAFLLSNSMTPFVRELYEGVGGFDVQVVLAGRAVNSKGDRRGNVEEALVSGGVRRG